MSAFLFDLDMTLLDTQALSVFRSQGNWPAVMSQLNRVAPFILSSGAILVHTLPETLRTLGHQTAIVTSSPKDYAVALCESFGIKFDILIAYHDTQEHKPSPEPLNAALAALGTKPECAYHVGDSPDDVQASLRAGVVSIGAGWNTDTALAIDSAPDILIHDPQLMLKAEDLNLHRYVAESIAGGVVPSWHDGSSLYRPGQYSGWFLGRYVQTGDSRHDHSQLSQKIIAYKNNDDARQCFSDALDMALERIQSRLGTMTLVPVPAKPSDKRPRVETMLRGTQIVQSSRVAVRSDLLIRRDDESMHSIEHVAERAAAAESMYSAGPGRVSGPVVLVDDVMTSGATIQRCCEILEHSGATWVGVVALAKAQHPFLGVVCPACGRSMRVRTNRTDGRQFWGCTGYPDCRRTISI